jgi:hypothetical protein
MSALDGMLVTYDAEGKIVDVAFYQVKFYPSPTSQVRLHACSLAYSTHRPFFLTVCRQLNMEDVKAAAARSILKVVQALGLPSKKQTVQWHLWYFGKGYSSPPVDDLRTVLAAVNATPHWHGADEVFRALPPPKQAVMLAVQKQNPKAYPVQLPSSE